MHLRSVDGKLTLGSVYRLCVVGWVVGWGLLFGVFLVLFALIVVLAGAAGAFGHQTFGAAAILVQMIPLIIMIPITVVIQAFIAAGLLTFGVWLFQTRRPLLEIVPDSPAA